MEKLFPLKMKKVSFCSYNHKESCIYFVQRKRKNTHMHVSLSLSLSLSHTHTHTDLHMQIGSHLHPALTSEIPKQSSQVTKIPHNSLEDPGSSFLIYLVTKKGPFK
jgi:hypothetical protein